MLKNLWKAIGSGGKINPWPLGIALALGAIAAIAINVSRLDDLVKLWFTAEVAFVTMAVALLLLTIELWRTRDRND